MSKPEASRKDRGDEAADNDAAPAGRWLRLKLRLRQNAARLLDRVIGLIQRQRQRLVPLVEEDPRANKKNASSKSAEAESSDKATPAKAKSARRRTPPLMTFLIGIVMLLVGAISGAVFSFTLFAQKINTQADFIATQADDVFEAEKQARHAERAMEKAKDELKAVTTELEESNATLLKTKTRLAEIEGRAMLYGSSADTRALQAEKNRLDAMVRQGSSQAEAATPRSNRSAGHASSNTCKLGSSDASKDLSRCLDQAMR